MTYKHSLHAKYGIFVVDLDLKFLGWESFVQTQHLEFFSVVCDRVTQIWTSNPHFLKFLQTICVHKSKRHCCKHLEPTMLPQYWRLYLLTLVLGVGGSFQYGMHISVITFPAEVVWEEHPFNCVTLNSGILNWKDMNHSTSDRSAAHSEICEPHVDAEIRGAAVWFQHPAHLVLHLGCVEPGRLGRDHSWWQTSCRLWAVRQWP